MVYKPNLGQIVKSAQDYLLKSGYYLKHGASAVGVGLLLGMLAVTNPVIVNAAKPVIQCQGTTNEITYKIERTKEGYVERVIENSKTIAERTTKEQLRGTTKTIFYVRTPKGNVPTSININGKQYDLRILCGKTEEEIASNPNLEAKMALLILVQQYLAKVNEEVTAIKFQNVLEQVYGTSERIELIEGVRKRVHFIGEILERETRGSEKRQKEWKPSKELEEFVGEGK